MFFILLLATLSTEYHAVSIVERERQRDRETERQRERERERWRGEV